MDATSKPIVEVATVPPPVQTTTSTTEHVPSPRAYRSATAPRRYVPQPAGVAPTYSGDIYDRLAMCESGMNAAANTGNGFYGAFQFMLSTWHGIGMSGNPIDYSYAEQKAAVQRSIPVSSWHRQFPVCSRRIGV